jgi:hypothetical protein
MIAVIERAPRATCGRATVRAMRRAWIVVSLLSLHCNSTPAPTDAAVDVAAPTDLPRVDDVTLDAPPAEDVFVRTTAPACPAFTPRPAVRCGTASTRLGVLAVDADLDARARRFDRIFHAVHARYTGVGPRA